MSNTSYALIMLIAGIGIPVLASLNASLGRSIGAPAAASIILFTVALSCVILVALITTPKAIPTLLQTPKYYWLAGVLVAFYLLSITYIAPHFGIGNAVFFVLLGQLISAALIDHFGLFGAAVSPINPIRAAGIAVMGLGVALTQFAR